MTARSIAVSLVGVFLAASLAVQAAEAAEVLPVSVIAPGAGQVIERQDTTGVAFVVQGIPPGASVKVSVAKTPAVEADGVTLSSASEDDFALIEDAAAPGTFRGVSNAAPYWWTDTPGTHYWQVSASWIDAPSGIAMFHVGASPAVPITVSPPATDALRRYYAAISIKRLDVAWRQLTISGRRQLGPYARFARGLRTTRSVRVTSARRLTAPSGNPPSTTVAFRIAAKDRDVCGRTIVRAFGGHWTTVIEDGKWRMEKPRIRQIGGPKLVTNRASCPQKKPTRPPASSVGGGSGGGGCNPNYADACIPNSPTDLDCGDVSARKFRVVGTDVYGFDGDGDGIACES